MINVSLLKILIVMLDIKQKKIKQKKKKNNNKQLYANIVNKVMH